jgi:hypothetical protein
MKTFIEKIIIVNRAPFELINLDFTENEIAILSAINGSGKTTLLSYIVDAWHEMARPHFENEFASKSSKFYRVSSNLYNLDQAKPSFVYIRFKAKEGYFDYVDIRNKCTEEEYDEAVPIENKIPFSQLKPAIDSEDYVKLTSENFKKVDAVSLFSTNLITYFPAYRHESPGYLNDIYKINLDFSTSLTYAGYLNNPIEVISGLPQLANWIMDFVVDLGVNNDKSELPLLGNLNTIITQTLVSKKLGRLRFGIGPRSNSGRRIQIMKHDGSLQIYPTIFNLSSGEAAILCLFGELLRQADKNHTNIQLNAITGIVLIDEVDKHLHIKLQKEVLPSLFNLFPNVQFILSSHSPFLSMGLAEKAKDRTKIIDLDKLGTSSDPTTNELYTEVYDMMVGENDRFRELFITLKEEIQKSNCPLIITEGKTDVQHLRKAKAKLTIDLDIDFSKVPEQWGDTQLDTLLQQLSKIKHNRTIIGVFDRDNTTIVKDIEKNGCHYKCYSDNVYAICIPSVNTEVYGEFTSIEHYYPKSLLLKKDDHERRLFLGKEFYGSGNSIDGVFETKFGKSDHKVMVNGVIDKEVYFRDDLEHKKSVALSKANFANLIEKNEVFVGDFDFSSFNLIFDRIKEVLAVASADIGVMQVKPVSEY